jgi:hypothetical protein
MPHHHCPQTSPPPRRRPSLGCPLGPNPARPCPAASHLQQPVSPPPPPSTAVLHAEHSPAMLAISSAAISCREKHHSREGEPRDGKKCPAATFLGAHAASPASPPRVARGGRRGGCSSLWRFHYDTRFSNGGHHLLLQVCSPVEMLLGWQMSFSTSP